MNPPEPAAQPASNRSPARRIAATVVLSGLVFVMLWIMAFGWLTSLLIGAGGCAAVVVASSVSDLVETLLDTIAAVIFGVPAVIAAILAAIFSLFDF
jgi:cytochrome b561